MKIFTIEFADGKFKKVASDITNDDIDAILHRWFVHLPVAINKKKYFSRDCEQECDATVADLNERMVNTEDVTEDTFAVRVCKDCGEPFLITFDTVQYYASKPNIKLPVRCKKCRELRRQKV